MMEDVWTMTLDPQVVEILGRQRLMAELLRDGLEVAVPARDRGVDRLRRPEPTGRLFAGVRRI